MKNKVISIIFPILLLLISCSSDDNHNTNASDSKEKRIIQLKYQDLEDSNNRLIMNIKYDNSGNLIEIVNNENDNIINSFSYNNLNQLIKLSTFSYYEKSSNIYAEFINTYEYNSENQISNIKQNNKYFSIDGQLSSERNKEYTISYSGSLITSENNNDFDPINKVEFNIENDLITKIKAYEGKELVSNFSFTYDAEGNCISGTGPTKGFSLDSRTDNIDLKASYGSEIKKPFMDFLFWPEILDKNTFESFREILVKYRGTRYPTTIEWFKYENYTYKEIYDNKFDEDGYLKSILLSRIPDLPNYGEFTYTWE